MDTHRQVENHSSRLDEEIAVELIGCNHRVQTKSLHTSVAKNLVTFEQLSFRKAILGFFGLADDHVPFASRSRVVTKAQ